MAVLLAVAASVTSTAMAAHRDVIFKDLAMSILTFLELN
jgi:hypothetical protein